MSRKLHVTLTDGLGAKLDQLAKRKREPPSRLAATLIRAGIEAANTADASPAAHPHSEDEPAGYSWIAPPSPAPEWRAWMWSTIAALKRRYPRILASIRADWWQHPWQVETLGALAAWRARLDHSDTYDPREELDFHAQLAHIGREIERTPGGTGSWLDTPPPTEWLEMQGTLGPTSSSPTSTRRGSPTSSPGARTRRGARSSESPRRWSCACPSWRGTLNRLSDRDLKTADFAPPRPRRRAVMNH